jgi:hypothetical protein
MYLDLRFIDVGWEVRDDDFFGNLRGLSGLCLGGSSLGTGTSLSSWTCYGFTQNCSTSTATTRVWATLLGACSNDLKGRNFLRTLQ